MKWTTALLVSMLFLPGCAGPPDEERIRTAINAMEEALENGEPGAFMDHVAEDFKSGGGGIDRRQLHSTLIGLMVRNEEISITRTSDEVTLFGDRATVVTRALVLGGAGLLPERSEHLEIESHWQKVDGDWVCFGATWK